MAFDIRDLLNIYSLLTIVLLFVVGCFLNRFYNHRTKKEYRYEYIIAIILFIVVSLGVGIIFEWCSGLCTAHVGDIEIFGFDDIKIISGWPNKFKTNIHLIKNEIIIAVIPIERHKENETF